MFLYIVCPDIFLYLCLLPVLRFLKYFCMLFGLRFKKNFCMLFVLRFLECFCMIFAECLCGINRCLFAFITFFKISFFNVMWGFLKLSLHGSYVNKFQDILIRPHCVYISFQILLFCSLDASVAAFYNNEYKIHDTLKRKRKEERGIIQFALTIEMVGSCCRKGRQ